MQQRIEWIQRTGPGRSGWEGKVGGRMLFTVSQSATRGEGYVLRTTLPCRLLEEFAIGDADTVKVYAERVLERFVRSLGADFN